MLQLGYNWDTCTPSQKFIWHSTTQIQASLYTILRQVTSEAIYPLKLAVCGRKCLDVFYVMLCLNLQNMAHKPTNGIWNRPNFYHIVRDNLITFNLQETMWDIVWFYKQFNTTSIFWVVQ